MLWLASSRLYVRGRHRPAAGENKNHTAVWKQTFWAQILRTWRAVCGFWLTTEPHQPFSPEANACSRPAQRDVCPKIRITKPKYFLFTCYNQEVLSGDSVCWRTLIVSVCWIHELFVVSVWWISALRLIKLFLCLRLCVSDVHPSPGRGSGRLSTQHVPVVPPEPQTNTALCWKERQQPDSVGGQRRGERGGEQRRRRL